MAIGCGGVCGVPRRRLRAGLSRRGMPASPRNEGLKHSLEISARLCQHVFVTRGMTAAGAALQKTVRDQSVEAPRQRVGAYTEALLKFIEVRLAATSLAQNQDAPPLADHFQATGDRAGHRLEGLASHELYPKQFSQ
jgi:hypothetical protein